MKQSRLYQGLVPVGMMIAVVLFTARRDVLPESEGGPVASSRRTRFQVPVTRDFSSEFRKLVSEKDCIRRDAGLGVIAGRWIEADPEEALDFVSRLQPGEVRDSFLRLLLVAWAEKDPGAAVAWTDGWGEGTERRHARSVIAFTLAEKDPRGAVELALRSGADDECGELLESLAMQWTEREPAGALEWVEAQPSGEWHDRLLARVAFVISKSDPLAAARQVAERMEPGPMQEEAVISILHQWAINDPASAVRWAQEFAPGSLRERALGELAGLDRQRTKQVE